MLNRKKEGEKYEDTAMQGFFRYGGFGFFFFAFPLRGVKREIRGWKSRSLCPSCQFFFPCSKRKIIVLVVHPKLSEK